MSEDLKDLGSSKCKLHSFEDIDESGIANSIVKDLDMMEDCSLIRGRIWSVKEQRYLT